jgi:hypothetical protein
MLIDVSEERTASIAIALTTWRYIAEDSKLYTRRHENLKSYKRQFIFGEVFDNFEAITLNNVTHFI